MFNLPLLILYGALFLLPVLTGCASFGERSLKIRNDFAGGNLEAAKAEIDKSLKKNRRKEGDLLKLNQAVIELSGGNAKKAEQLLQEVRDRFDRNEIETARRTSEKAASMLLDDNAVAYSGEDYEKVLIRVFLALSNLMLDGSDAHAYALQIGQKQNEIIRKRNDSGIVADNGKPLNLKTESYRQAAIGAYLAGTLQEETFRNFDDACKNYEAVCAWEPAFSQGRKDLERAKTGVPCQRGNGVVYVIGLIGAGPYKVQQNCEVLQAAQFMTTAMLSMMSSKPVIPDFAPVMIPCVVRPPETVSSLAVSIDGKWNAQSETLTDIGRMAEEQFEAIKPQIIARAVLRRAVKKAVIYGVKDGTDSNPWVSLALELGGIFWESLETADTRCWNLLPAEIQVSRLEIPAGEHRLTLQPCSRIYSSAYNRYIVSADSVHTGSEESRMIRVESGCNTYVLANFPGSKLVGKIVSSRE
ncbi:MAG: hypothetical protein LBT46_08230 [Planctomycetaceae bacterium]|jgi:hypothetical protein|nr:hypothetical protein [Planctomycetaceae bacterium]